jgi:hypothetical protein
MNAINDKNLFEDEFFITYYHYTEFIENYYQALHRFEELEIIVDKDILSKIEIPKFLLEYSEESGIPLWMLVNYALKFFHIEMTHGKHHTNKSILAIIKNYQGLKETDKINLFLHIFKNLKERSTFYD